MPGPALRSSAACGALAALVVAAVGATGATASAGAGHRFGGGRIVAGAAASSEGSLLRPDPTASPARGGRRPVRALRLSDERTRTVWANARRSDWVRIRPRAGARRIRRLHAWTEDGFPEVYLVLGAARDARGAWWAHVRLPMRPNGTTGWVPRRALGPLHVVFTQLVVDRRTKHIALWSHGRKVWRARVGVGKPSTPTPPGHFWIREGFEVTGDPLYGPYAFGTSDYSVLSDWPGGGVIGIHGTDQPYLIPGAPSHGCIRLRNADIRWLSRHLPIGTPLRVL